MRLGYIDFLYGFGLSYKFYKYTTLLETEKPITWTGFLLT